MFGGDYRVETLCVQIFDHSTHESCRRQTQCGRLRGLQLRSSSQTRGLGGPVKSSAHGFAAMGKRTSNINVKRRSSACRSEKQAQGTNSGAVRHLNQILYGSQPLSRGSRFSHFSIMPIITFITETRRTERARRLSTLWQYFIDTRYFFCSRVLQIIHK